MNFNFNSPSHDSIIDSYINESNYKILTEYLSKPLIFCDTKKFKCHKKTQKQTVFNKLIEELKNFSHNEQLNVIHLNSKEYEDLSLIVTDKKDSCCLSVSLNDTHDFVIFYTNIHSTSDNLISIVNTILDKLFKEHIVYLDTTNIQWHFLKQNQLQKIEVDEPLHEHIFDSFYPSLTSSISLTQFIENYIDNKASVLLLYGPPGTGKTTLIRHICSHAQGTVYYTNDSKVMEHSDFFMNFLTDSDSQFLVLEDIDIHLESREKGNSFMYQLLGTADGFIRNRNKKIIISSNIHDVSNVDSALLRDGRCWGQFKINLLNQEQSYNVLRDLNKTDIVLGNTNYSLSKLFAM